MRKPIKPYTHAFRETAISLVKHDGYSIREAARLASIHEKTLRRWLKQHRICYQMKFEPVARQVVGVPPNFYQLRAAKLAAENRQLKRLLHDLAEVAH